MAIIFLKFCVFIFSLTSTKLRHIAVSLLSSVLPAKTKDLASLMTHSEKEQQMTYKTT